MKNNIWLPLVSLVLASTGAHAELRVYDASSKQSVTPVSRETQGQQVDKKGVAKITGVSPTGAVSPQGQPVQRAGGVQSIGKSPTPLLKPSTPPLLPTQPKTGAATQGAAFLKPGQAAGASGASKALREAEGIYIFTSINAYSPAVFKAVQSLQAAGHKRMQVFMGDAAPTTLAKFVSKNSSIVPEQGFAVDTRGLMAKRLGVTTPNTLVYVAPNGAIRLYHLPDELENLQRQLERLQTPTSTKNTKKR